MPFLTPEEIPDEYVTRVIRIPASLEWLALVAGALEPLFFSSEWRKKGAVSTEDASQEMKKLMDTFYSGSGFIGSVVPYLTETIPPTMLPCDGSLYDAADYPLLYAALPAALKVGGDQFVTPNLGGRVIVGGGDGTSGLTHRDPFDIGGEETHVLTVGELANHAHTINMANVYNGIVVPGSPDIAPGQSVIDSVVTNGKGLDEPHENMQPFYVLNYGVVYA